MDYHAPNPQSRLKERHQRSICTRSSSFPCCRCPCYTDVIPST